MPKHLTTNDTGSFITAAQIGADNGVAQLGPDGKVPDDQLPAASTGSVNSVNGKIGNVTLTSTDVGALPTGALGAPNGAATLDGSSKLTVTQMPSGFVQTTSLGVANGVATLGSDGKLTAGQTPTAPVTSVAGRTGAVVVTSTDVGALATTTRAAANGVASLDGTTKVPIAQIPSLLTLYQPVPGATPAKPGMVFTAIAGGSNSAQWSEQTVYIASSAGGMPTSIPTGTLCVRIDNNALYQWNGGGWTAIVAPDPGWAFLTLPSGTRGYNGNDEGWRPKYKKIGNQVWIRGRIELTSGANFANGYSFNVPAGMEPQDAYDLTGTCTTAAGQIGVARFQLNETGIVTFYAGSGPNPNTPWLGWNFSYWID